jgi:hypothetical protein
MAGASKLVEFGSRSRRTGRIRSDGGLVWWKNDIDRMIDRSDFHTLVPRLQGGTFRKSSAAPRLSRFSIYM